MSIDEKSNYYDVGGISTMDVIKAKLSKEQFAGFLLGNIIKYSSRLNHKGCADRDSEKLAVYSRLLTDLLTKKEGKYRNVDDFIS